MVVDKALLLKGLGVCAICAGGGTVILLFKDNISSLFAKNPHPSIHRLGLYCGEARVEGSDCSIYPGGKILVKREGEDILEVSDFGKGKIRLYKAEGEKSYREGFKFTIEDNDIVTNNEGSVLGELETYGIDEKDGKYLLSRKTEAKEEIKKGLGLDCDLPSENCDISNDKLNKIKFSGKGETVTLTGGSTTLSISQESSKDSYPLGYRFTFKNSNETDSTLTLSTEKSITIKKDIDVDFRIKKDGFNLFLDSWSLEDLAEKVGLKKVGNDWTIKDEGIRVKHGDEKKYGNLKKASGYTNGKIKVHEGQTGYYQGFKFSIEERDFTLANGESSDTNVTLGEHETYEIKKDGDGTWYLSRVKDSGDAIKTSLGLTCDLPTGSQTSVECTGEINKIKFSGSETVTTTGTPKLTIHKEDLRQHYPMGYRFAFTSGSGDASIVVGNVTTTLKQGITSDFKIKVGEGGKMTLDPWTPEELMEKVYFKKESDYWTLRDGSMSVKQGNNKTLFIKKGGNTSGKIKLQKGAAGYNQGFKFSIEDGNFTFEEDSSISQLSKYETYEVSVDDTDGQMYFSRKQNSSEVIKEKLGIPTECAMPSHTTPDPTCQLDADKLKGIKFSGKGEADTVTINGGGNKVTLKISKAKAEDFPLGYKFTIVSDKEVTFSGSSGPAAIKANTNTEFKIKEESGGNLSLEKAWDINKLGGKINLSSCGNSGSTNKCSFGDKINVWESDSARAENATVADKDNKKITYEEGQDGYNQGFKFKVEEEVSISGWTSSGSNPPSSIKKDESGTEVSYQIMEKTVKNNTKWYLVKKS